jgi:peptide/nickel transport system substrate-binding protein
MTEARATGDPDARKTKYAQPVSILFKDLTIVYLYHSKWIYVFSANLQSFKTYPDGIIRLTGLSRS